LNSSPGAIIIIAPVNAFFATSSSEGFEKCDQIGRIFARRAIDYFGQYFEHYKSSPKFWRAFFHRKKYVLKSTEYALG
jgi:hypothetical protein